ncbi:MAG: hypothetical protein IJC83_02695 [Oscillospiraceae bacterium]|nr:hypothetical protein [Oscillospiraceae bacterium]
MFFKQPKTKRKGREQMNGFNNFFDFHSVMGFINQMSNLDFKQDFIKSQSGFGKTNYLHFPMLNNSFGGGMLPTNPYANMFPTPTTNFGFGSGFNKTPDAYSLMNDVYKRLWGASKDYSDFVTISAFREKDDKKLLFDNEVFNPLQTTLNALSKNKKSTPDYMKEYEKNTEKFKEMMDKMGMTDMLGASNTLGNFGLVPAFFGEAKKEEKKDDYLDNSLETLFKNGFDYLDKLMQVEKEDKKKKKKKPENVYRNFSSNDFKKYVNTMFLWDMIDMAGDEVQIADISTNLEKWKTLTPKIIQRRSLFMAMMFYFAMADIPTYQKLIGVIVNSDEILCYDEVFELFNEIPLLSDNHKRVIRQVERNISDIELDELDED